MNCPYFTVGIGIGIGFGIGICVGICIGIRIGIRIFLFLGKPDDLFQAGQFVQRVVQKLGAFTTLALDQRVLLCFGRWWFLALASFLLRPLVLVCRPSGATLHQLQLVQRRRRTVKAVPDKTAELDQAPVKFVIL